MYRERIILKVINILLKAALRIRTMRIYILHLFLYLILGSR